jgi:hypothetical protein
MSIFSVPIVADAAARKIKRVKRLEPDPALRFDDVAAVTTQLRIPTRHGTVCATMYPPPGPVPNVGIYINFHGGGFV